MTAARRNVSAGVLLFRQRNRNLEILLGHPGGPYCAKKDAGVWTIPKGFVEVREEMISAALRVFEKETGHRPEGDPVLLGEARQAGGKIVHVWAVEGDFDASKHRSNTVERSGPRVRASCAPFQSSIASRGSIRRWPKERSSKAKVSS